MIELTKEVKQQVIGLVREYLTDKFTDDDPIVFDPIVIDPRVTTRTTSHTCTSTWSMMVTGLCWTRYGLPTLPDTFGPGWKP